MSFTHVAVATISSKTYNEDYCLQQNFGSVHVSVVADGLGSFTDSHIASKLVCNKVVRLFEQATSKEELSLSEVFEKVAWQLDLKYDELKSLNDYGEREAALGTTLIVCVESETCYRVGYIGNGAVFHLRGNFTEQTLNDSLPRVMVNYLNPHVIMSGSGARMYKLLEPRNTHRDDFSPSLITIEKNKDVYGDILMLCTDGIYSLDEIGMGRGTKDNKIWVEGSERLHLFCVDLRDAFSSPKNLNNYRLEPYLDTLRNNDLLDDDATISVHISRKAIEYHNKSYNVILEEE